MLRRTLAIGTLALTSLWASPAMAQAVDVDPDGAGAAVPIVIDSLDWNVGNSVAEGFSVSFDANGIPSVPTDPFQVYYQANLSNFNLDGGPGTFANNNGTGNDSWTLVLGFGEVVTAQVPVGGSQLILGFGFADQTGFDNFFQIYANSGPASELSGSCFVCGTLIMEGHFIAEDFVSTFTVNDLTANEPLDNAPAGDDDYPGVETIEGAGVVDLTAVVDTYDSAYFVNPLQFITFALAPGTGTALPFQTVDPSACFFDDDPVTDGCQGGLTYAGGSVTSFAGVGGVGPDNGIAGDGGDNTMFQSDASSSFVVEQAIPEPASLTLFGLGLAGAAAARRRKKAKKQ